MPHPVYTPRVNNNDDTVQLVRLAVQPGDRVKAGQVVAEVETDKAVVEVTAEQEGYVLKIVAQVDERIAVGSVLMWLGASADEAVPEAAAPVAAAPGGKNQGEMTAKARALLDAHGLKAADLPRSGERLSARDIEAYLAARGEPLAKPAQASKNAEPALAAAGVARALSLEEQGMVNTVAWHRDHAVATYLELEYDPKPWEDYAAAYAAEHKLMLSPLLPLLAYRLVELARDNPKVNSTLANGQKYRYENVNLGFTVQAGEMLYLTVVRRAERMDAQSFIQALGEVQRRAIAKKLGPSETQGATVSFSSMARWNVSRHIPILPPYNSLMIAHAAPKRNSRAVLGASYDHRVLSGYDVARLLQKLSQPPVKSPLAAGEG
jgi:pyruvate/2-oxoglutarate dehydrogenase complex dihydrolipoamide acyltransferase (E2) component